MIASEVTGTPGQLCLLWEVPDVERIEQTVAYFAYEAEDMVRERYAEMMAGIQTLTRRYMYPESTEQIDDENPKPQPVSAHVRRDLAQRLRGLRNHQ